jgi:hypothetical protein
MLKKYFIPKPKKRLLYGTAEWIKRYGTPEQKQHAKEDSDRMWAPFIEAILEAVPKS